MNRLRNVLTPRSISAALALLLVAAAAPAHAAKFVWLPLPRASVYRYDGNVYDRLFSALAAPRERSLAKRGSLIRPTALSGTPYAITDLDAVFTGSDGQLLALPTGVNNAGRIVVYDECECFSGEDYQQNAGVVTDDLGDQFGTLLGVCCFEGVADAEPYAINDLGYAAGNFSYGIGGNPNTFAGNITWRPAGGAFYFDGADNGSTTLAINDANVAVGQDVGPKGVFAGAYSLAPSGLMRRVLLLPPKNTSWVGTATGIDDSGEIVGYATFRAGGGGRAVRFYEHGYAQVLPVGAPGVSTSAQAINVHGDVVGSAGSQAFLYKNNRVTYLPRPPGETAGNAVAYAVNASDDIVGDIVSATGTTAFLYTGGRSYDLDSLLAANSGWSIATASGINDSGQIVGTGYDANDFNGFGFSMKPQTTR